MDRTIAVFEGNKYRAYVNSVNKKIISIELFSHIKENGFIYRNSPYDKNLYVREVTEKDVTELYREYFMARYLNYDFFVSADNKINREIEILTVDSNISRECKMDWKDRDLFTKCLGEDDQYQLFYIREDYLQDKVVKKESTLDEYFQIDNEKLR